MLKRISGSLFLVSLLLQTHAFAETAPVVHGPTRYVRTTGAPNSYHDTFRATGSSGAAYKLVVENGASGESRLSSAVLLLNGQEVVKQNELNQTITIVEKPVALAAENTLDVRLAGGPSGSLTVSIVCVSGCAPGSGGGGGGGGGVTITSPSSGSLVNRSQVIIKGTISGLGSEVGVTIRSENADSAATTPAEIQGTLFAGIVPLKTGDNTITVTATDASGKSATDTMRITTQSIGDPVTLTANPAIGTAPLAVTFTADSSLPSAANYAWDTNGDGTMDRSGAELLSLSVTYDTPGLYFPSVTVTDGTGRLYTDTAVINVMDRTRLDALLRAKWEGMKTALLNKDIEMALNYFAESSKESFRQHFTQLNDKLPQIVGDMGQLRLAKSRGIYSECDLRNIRNGQEYSFQVLFMRDVNGTWKIRSF